MNILILCPHFSPDLAPTGEVMTAIVGALAERGHRLHVVTALPWYREHRVDSEWQGSRWRTDATDWGWITRLHPFPTDKTNIPARALGFAGFCGLATLAGMTTRQRPDVVLVMSPPLPLGAAGWVAAMTRRAPMVFNIQDVFPDVAVEIGAITNPRVIAAASWLERFLYRRSDAVTVLSDDLRANLAAKLTGHRPERVVVIPNFVDTVRIQPAPAENAYRAEFGLEGKRVVMYAGNVGMSQSLDLVVAAASAMVDDPDTVFVVNGDGSGRPALEAAVAGLPNVRLVGLQPRERLPEVLAAADIHVVPLKRGLAKASVPSKLYSILAAGRPIVASVDPGTEVARTLQASGAGVAVPPDDPESFTKALRSLLDDESERARLGAAGRAWVQDWVSPAAVGAQYEELFDRVVTERAARRAR